VVWRRVCLWGGVSPRAGRGTRDRDETGTPVWQEMEVAMYAWDDLKLLPESERDRKESQLRINLETAMVGLADSLTDEGLTTRQLRTHYGND